MSISIHLNSWHTELNTHTYTYIYIYMDIAFLIHRMFIDLTQVFNVSQPGAFPYIYIWNHNASFNQNSFVSFSSSCQMIPFFPGRQPRTSTITLIVWQSVAHEESEMLLCGCFGCKGVSSAKHCKALCEAGAGLEHGQVWNSRLKLGYAA